MGAFKNILIANQVELGDRVPEPKPAQSHVALQKSLTRRHLRNLERLRKAEHNAIVIQSAAFGLSAGILFTLVLLLIGGAW